MKRGSKKKVRSSTNADAIKEMLVEDDKIIKEEGNKLIAEEQKAILKEEKSLFQNVSSLKHHHKVLFTVIIVTAVIFVWRGLWNLIDRYWFPSLTDFSDISGIIVGIGILFIMRKAVNQLAD